MIEDFEKEGSVITKYIAAANQLETEFKTIFNDVYNDFGVDSYGYSGTSGFGGISVLPILLFIGGFVVFGNVLAGRYLYRFRSIRELPGRIPGIITVSIVPVIAILIAVIAFIVFLSGLNGQTAIAVAIGFLAVVILILGVIALVIWARK